MSIRTNDRDEIAADFNIPSDILDRAGISELLGLTHYAVHDAIGRGAPILRKGLRSQSWQINAAAFLAWLVADAQAAAFRSTSTRRAA
jgi:phage terminase Nu1 subunit (DNA packaging protein)